jgi:hypothetical protein
MCGDAGDHLIEADNADFVDSGSGSDVVFLGFVFEAYGGRGNDELHVDSAVSTFADSEDAPVDVVFANSVDCGSGRDAFVVGNGVDLSPVVRCEMAAVIQKRDGHLVPLTQQTMASRDHEHTEVVSMDKLGADCDTKEEPDCPKCRSVVHGWLVDSTVSHDNIMLDDSTERIVMVHR